jgi:hypothetical protein
MFGPRGSYKRKLIRAFGGLRAGGDSSGRRRSDGVECVNCYN